MSDRTKIAKGTRDKLEPLTWFLLFGADGPLYPMVRCDKGHEAGMGDHTVDANGDVTPSMVCPAEGCDFHRYVTLEGWEPG